LPFLLVVPTSGSTDEVDDDACRGPANRGWDEHVPAERMETAKSIEFVLTSKKCERFLHGAE